MSFDPFSQNLWEGSNTASLNASYSLAPSKVQKNRDEFPSSFFSKSFPGSFLSKDSVGNLLSKDLPVSLLLQQISSGLLSPDDLDPNTREMVLIYCKEITEGIPQRRGPNKAGQDAVVPKNNFRRNGLVPNISPNVNHLTNPLTNPLTNTSLSETVSGVSSRGMFDNGSLIPTKSEMGESAFQSFGNDPQVFQLKSGGAFLNSQMATEKNTGFFPGLQTYGISMPTANKQAEESPLYPFHIGTDSSQVIPSNPGTTYLNTDLTGQQTGLSMGTMFQSSLIPPTDSEIGESAFSSFNGGIINGPQYKQSSLGGPFLTPETSTGNLFTAGSFKAEVGESAFRAFNNGGSSSQFLSLNSGGDFLGLQGSKERNIGVSTEPMFHPGPMASENRQNEENISLPFNLEGNGSQIMPVNLGTFLLKHGSSGFQDGEIPTVPEISTLPVSGQAISHVPSFPDPVPVNPGALARQQRASADSKRGKRRKPPVEAMVVPENGNVNPPKALVFPSEKIGVSPVVKAKEERRNKRLLRNRVSAQQARERKRHQMMEMEDYCSQIELKNAEFEERLVFLREENELLRQIVRDNMRARRQNRSKNSDDSVSQSQNDFNMDVINPVLSLNGRDGMNNWSLPSSSIPTYGNGGRSIELERRSEELKRLSSLGGESEELFQAGSTVRGNNGNGGYY